VSSCLTQWNEIQGLFAFGEPLEAGVWVLLFAEMIVAAACLMLVEGYGDNEALPLNPWGLIMDCWFLFIFSLVFALVASFAFVPCSLRMRLHGLMPLSFRAR
jgi:hypothetical protein